MSYPTVLKAFCILGLVTIFLVPALQAKPRTSVKNTLTREENPRVGTKNSLMPYAFSSESMGFTLGVGGGAKGYGQDPKNRAYTGRFRQDTIRAGSNDSDMDDYVEDSGDDNWTDFKMEFVMPWGSSRSDAMQYYTLKDSLLKSAPVGGNTWNPMKSGVTTLLQCSPVQLSALMLVFPTSPQPAWLCSDILFKGMELKPKHLRV
ncbi:hypothetical protein UWK_01570 [Desulfocapsa sulfexigens DSM 10523]|uniref:Uncharacterized protein n=1 Tax=Desulfocapsa sulfexigens (strain DSM 10523 / SB164P1) TaxID=1167006 RepID=M1P3S4_DESSD|nr:hypothetical protein [Desulfocapsa sulfexigens]AGF78128.1 hypothetical protein UWK_01570 [Desulfocapsa sulfexigens DSM 10523]